MRSKIHIQNMKLSQFKFNLPESLIANHPSENRDESRLMVLDRKTGSIEHKIFKDVLGYFNEKDVLILNNTKVIPARLFGKKNKNGASIEVFLVREIKKDHWLTLVKPGKRLKEKNIVYFNDDLLIVATHYF